MDDSLDAQHPASEEEYFTSETAAEKINWNPFYSKADEREPR